LEKNLVKYNELCFQNTTLRAEIDVKRKQMKNQSRVNVTLRKDIVSAADNAKKLNMSTYQG